MLERIAGKLARCVLRGERGSNAPALPGQSSHLLVRMTSLGVVPWPTELVVRPRNLVAKKNKAEKAKNLNRL